MKSECVNRFRRASLWKDTNVTTGRWSYRLMYNDKLVATDRSRRWLQEIMYQVG